MADEPTQTPPFEGSTQGASPALDFIRKYIWWIGGIGGLVMITVMRPFMIHRAPAPPVIAEVPPDFELTDQDGRPFTPESMHGEVWVVGFMFTKCPSLCPQITSAMQQYQDALDRAKLGGHVKLLSVSVDPENDTPEALKAYAESYGIDESSWRIVTAGDAAKTEAFVVGGFKVGVGEKKEIDPGVFDIAHSSKLALVDREGGIRGFYSIDEDGLEELFHRSLVVARIEDE